MKPDHQDPLFPGFPLNIKTFEAPKIISSPSCKHNRGDSQEGRKGIQDPASVYLGCR